MKDIKTVKTLITRKLLVSGITWQGFRAVQYYPLSPGQYPSTRRDAKMIAGDFDDVEFAKTVTTTEIINKTVAEEILT